MRKNVLCIAGLFCLLSSIGLAASFTESAAARGVAHSGNFAQGVSFVDIDNDGDDDMSLGVHSAGVRVFINNGSGNFTAGPTPQTGPSGGPVIWFDYDKDNDLDCVVGYAFQNTHFYRNDGAAYTEVSDLLSADPAEYTNRFCVLASDFDKNGFVDIALSPFSTGAGVNRIYAQNAGTFTDVATAIAADIVGSRGGNTLDYDNDGDVDIYICGDGAPSILYRNDGAGVFTNVATGSPIDNASRNGRGSAWGDLDNDGDLDCVIANTNGGGNAIIRNDAGTFVAVGTTFDSGIADAIGPVLFDCDNDGDLDIFVQTLNSAGGPAKLYRNDGGFGFTDITASDVPAMGSNLADGRGAAVGDVDNDGDLDLYQANGSGGPSYFYVNNTNNSNWLKVKVAPTSGDKQAFGARISVFNAGTNVLRGFRQIQSETAYLSQDSLVQHFGVPVGGLYDVKVYFPFTNNTTTVSNVPPTQTITVVNASDVADWSIY